MAVRNRWIEFVVEYLREYESIFETPLAHESGDPELFFDEKPDVEKSRVSGSLMPLMVPHPEPPSLFLCV
jgi:hypothetical protein